MLVVKLGGGAGGKMDPLLDELSVLDEPWVLVHGGSAVLDEVSQQIGHPPRFVTSPGGHTSRFTDERTVELIQMVYRGRVNNDLVHRLVLRGVQAVGLSGVDAGLMRAKRKEAVRVEENGRRFMLRGDHTGRIEQVDASLLRLLVDGGYRPVVTLPALASTGEVVNVDADRAAAMVARALDARELVILSNVPGLLRDREDPESLVHRIDRDELEEFERFAEGRFRKKMLAAREALEGGVSRVVLAPSDHDRPLQAARDGQGTVIE
jgi:[amino group carrier protein]-L-2-aminoadipate 6-kinase